MTYSGTTKSDVLQPEILTDEVQGVFAQKNAFMGSELVQNGIVVVNDSFSVSDRALIGSTVKVPYFGTVGEFEDNVTDGDDSTAVWNKILQTSEEATIKRDRLLFALTTWANNSGVGDPYGEAARQILESATRKMDSNMVTVMAATGCYTKDVYSATVPQKLSYDLVVNAQAEAWGDQGSTTKSALIVHSRTAADLGTIKDANGRPLLVDPVDGQLSRIARKPIIESDKMPMTGSTMGTVTPAGSSPPTLTITGTPTGPWNLKIQCTTIGGDGVAKFKFSTDGGQTWSGILTKADMDVASALTDTTADSVAGHNGKTGLSIAFSGNFTNVDNAWTSVATCKMTSLIVRPGAGAFWYNREALRLLTQPDIANDASLYAMHLYSAPCRYRRARGSTKCGVIRLVHNVTPIS